MNTDLIWQTSTKNPEETESLAEQIGLKLKGGEKIELTSDLGGGKTTFTRGLVRGSGSVDHVTSPTYKVCNVYKAPKFEILHYDFYRLPEAGLMRHELADALEDPNIVIIVEWADVIQEVLPHERLHISIKSKSETARLIDIRAPKSLGYLLQGLRK